MTRSAANRLATLRLLAATDMTVTEAAEALKCEPSNASHNLRRMKKVGLVESKKDGQHMYYALDRRGRDRDAPDADARDGITVAIPLR